MDELDALIPKRGNSGDSNQVMDRIVAELLMQMDIASSNQVFVIGATNRPDLLDPSILRPGRFDKQIYLGITTDLKDRVKILKAQTRHLTLGEDIDWEQLLQKLPANLTGADFYGLTSKAVMAAAERVIE
jgi:peroxin-6